jgi:diguanylate cyclase (GGDEF)-like protein
MDERSATQVCLRLQQLECARGGSALPKYLIVVKGSIPGAMLRLSLGETRLGRGAGNTYQLQERCISRYHALLRADAKGEVWLTDLGSTNGTHLNGSRLQEYAPTRIKDGDRIQLGSAIVVKYVHLDPSEERFQREMFERTVRDSLTNLYNRWFFLNQVGSLAEFGSRRGLGLAVLMLDLDHFKRINDSFGHDTGDAVLRGVAAVLRESTRPEDLVARYGGEEFVLALPAAAADQATERAERIRTTLASRPIPAPSGELNVTASLGLAYARPGRLGSPNALITAADRCLYQAKRTGRDRLVIGEAPILLNDDGSAFKTEMG